MFKDNEVETFKLGQPTTCKGNALVFKIGSGLSIHFRD